MEEGPPEGAHIEEQVATRKGEQRTKAPLPNGGTDTSQAPWDNVAQLLLRAATTTLPPNEQRNVVACSPGRVDRAEKLAATRSGHLCNSPRISSIREGG